LKATEESRRWFFGVNNKKLQTDGKLLRRQCNTRQEAFTAVASERKRNGTVVSVYRIPLRRGFAALVGCLRCQQ
jgi:uncharacterized protein YaaQ